MQVNPYLFYNGNCEEALKYYQKVLGAQIEATMPYGDGPAVFISKVMQVFMNLDDMIGEDFEVGLANLKKLTEK